jgi:hypothetical protein
MTLLRNLATLALLAILGLATLGGMALAEPRTEGRAAIVQKLVDCRKLTDDSARLACYDQATAAFDQAEAKGDVVVIDRDQARKVRRQAFGFTLPSISIFAKGESQEEVDTSDGVVATARQDGAGHWVVKLEDGAVWAQVDSNELFKTPKAGMPVKIRKAALGSYLMDIGNQRAFRAHRVE